jgi:endonuclease/exonuclease/phosphatase family metal-dependent hydrolase
MSDTPFHFVLGTWNCFGTPQSLDAVAARFAPYPQRFVSRVMRDGAEGPDVLCVQELFSDDAHTFFDGLEGFATRERDRAAIVASSGLGIASRFAPTVHASVHAFTAMASGTDALAKKGAMHARVPLTKGPELDVVTAHLQASDDAAARDVRASQIRELGAFVARVSAPERPLVVCGDFNVDGLRAADGIHGPEYALLKQSLAGLVDLGAFSDGATSDPRTNAMLRAYEPDAKPERLDYVFFRPGSADPTGLRATGLALLLDQYLSDLPQPQWIDVGHAKPCVPFASDHYGLRVTFTYDPKP